MIDEVLDTFLADFGKSVVWGTVSGTGVLDMPEQIIGGQAFSVEYLLTAKATQFGSLSHGDSIIVDDVNYTVRDVRLVDDGSFCQISLTKV